MPPISGPVGAPPPAAPSLFTSVRTFWRVLITILHTRLDLLTTELGEEAFRALYLVVAVALALFCLHTALLFALIFLLAAVWDTHYRLWVIGGITVFYFLVGAIALLAVRRMVTKRPRFLGQTLDELKRDVEGLHEALKPREEEKKP